MRLAGRGVTPLAFQNWQPLQCFRFFKVVLGRAPRWFVFVMSKNPQWQPDVRCLFLSLSCGPLLLDLPALFGHPCTPIPGVGVFQHHCQIMYSSNVGLDTAELFVRQQWSAQRPQRHQVCKSKREASSVHQAVQVRTSLTIFFHWGHRPPCMLSVKKFYRRWNNGIKVSTGRHTHTDIW